MWFKIWYKTLLFHIYVLFYLSHGKKEEKKEKKKYDGFLQCHTGLCFRFLSFQALPDSLTLCVYTLEGKRKTLDLEAQCFKLQYSGGGTHAKAEIKALHFHRQHRTCLGDDCQRVSKSGEADVVKRMDSNYDILEELFNVELELQDVQGFQSASLPLFL